MFSIEQLDAFIQTVEQGSFSAAARKLGKVQSAVSQHIMNMEIDCGYELFDRSGRYPLLTAQGSQLLPHAKAAVIQHRRLINCAHQLDGRQYQDITLAVDEGIPMSQLSIALQSVSEQFPMIHFECLSASSIDILQLVRDRRATMGIMFSEASLDESIDFEGLGNVAFDVYVAKQHSLASLTIPHLDALRLHRQIVIRSKSSEMSSFQKAHSPDVWYADSHYVSLELISNGFGWGMLPIHIAQPALEAGQLVRVKSQFENLTWHANIDVVQHQSVSNCAAHKCLRNRLTKLHNESAR